MVNKINSRIVKNLIAHSFGQFVTISAVILIPWVCLSKWNADEFGVWVIASAISQFFLLSDFGATNALANKVCIEHQSEFDIASVLNLFSERFLIRVFLVVICLIFSYFALLFFGDISIRVADSSSLLACLFVCLAASLQPIIGFAIVIFRFYDKNHEGVIFVNLVRMCEIAALLVPCSNGVELVETTEIVFVTKVLICLLLYIFYKLKFQTTKKEYSIKEKQIAADSLGPTGYGFFLNFVSNNILMHGMVLVVSVLGAISSAIYSTIRTLSRLPNQPMGVLYLATAPEITRSYSRLDYFAIKKYVRRQLFLGVFLSAISGFFELYFLDFINQYWLHGKIQTPHELVLIMVVAAGANILSQCFVVALNAINITYKPGVKSVFFSLATIFLGLLAASYFGLKGVAVILLFGEVIILIMNYKWFSSALHHA